MNDFLPWDRDVEIALSSMIDYVPKFFLHCPFQNSQARIHFKGQFQCSFSTSCRFSNRILFFLLLDTLIIRIYPSTIGKYWDFLGSFKVGLFVPLEGFGSPKHMCPCCFLLHGNIDSFNYWDDCRSINPLNTSVLVPFIVDYMVHKRYFEIVIWSP